MSGFLKQHQRFILLFLSLCVLCVTIVTISSRHDDTQEPSVSSTTPATNQALSTTNSVVTTQPDSQPVTEAPTISTEIPTEISTQPTQPPAESEAIQPTTHPTEVPTEAPTEVPTEAPTQPSEAVTYKKVDETVYALRSANIRSGPGKSYDKLDTLEWAGSIRRIGIGSNGWSQVIYNGQTAYMYSAYLSTTQPTGYAVGASGLTELQEAVLAVIESGKVTAKEGYCQAWVADIYYKAGTGSRSSRCCAAHAGEEWGVSNDWSTIQVGATVYGYGSSVYGHVGIYIGNGKVAHNVGYVKIDTLEDWIKLYDGQCWGWNGGYNLTGKSIYNCKRYGTYMVAKH